MHKVLSHIYFTFAKTISKHIWNVSCWCESLIHFFSCLLCFFFPSLCLRLCWSICTFVINLFYPFLLFFLYCVCLHASSHLLSLKSTSTYHGLVKATFCENAFTYHPKNTDMFTVILSITLNLNVLQNHQFIC